MPCPNCGKNSNTPSLECCSYECWEKLYTKETEPVSNTDDTSEFDIRSIMGKNTVLA